jgi:rhodanese-related sulfurtransferase
MHKNKQVKQENCDMKTTKSYEDLSSPAFQQRLKNSTNAALMDVRTSQEFREGHISESINLDVTDASFHEGIKSLDKSKTYFVYCRSGGRSRQACAILADLGFTVINLAGGIIAWTGEVI